ncbi:MAG TPA: GNAT family N-acetyltransferase [Rhodothermales bacterium]|nr:GNAT family N-acetyltransferase [Rhodothermales bacterium]
MISLHKCSDLSSILDLKAQYLQSLLAPMDGMWESIINSSPHWEIRMDREQAGYYAANDEGTLLQFYVRSAFQEYGRTLFDHVIAQGTLTRAIVSTIDPSFLSLCLDVQKKLTVQTYLYEIHTEVCPSHPEADGLDFRLIKASELDQTIAFQQACLCSEKDLSGWLRGYSANLIERKELFVLCRNGEWLGLGECRKSDSQQGVTDLGMMVIPAHRGKGWATYILTYLSTYSTAHGQHAICSTTVENVGAQKAIIRSGFTSRHRILNVELPRCSGSSALCVHEHHE